MSLTIAGLVMKAMWLQPMRRPAVRDFGTSNADRDRIKHASVGLLDDSVTAGLEHAAGQGVGAVLHHR